MPKESEGTRQNILDSAEKLFAKKGFHGVSIRDITAGAGVDVALANYHFGPKVNLLAAVLERRAQLLNDERLHMLLKARQAAAPKTASAEAIINAFTYPLNNKSARGGPGWKSYFALVAQINNSPEWGGTMMSQYFDHVVQIFIDALREVFPECDPRELYWAYHFLSGALTLTFAETRRVDNLSGGLCKSTDLDAVHERLVPFCVGGFEALCERSRAKTRLKGKAKGKARPRRGRKAAKG